MKRTVLLALVCLWATQTTAFCSEEDTKSAFALSLFLGLEPGGGRVNLLFLDEEAQVNPSFAYGFDVSYGRIALSHSLRFHLSSEINVFRSQTDATHEQFGDIVAAQYTYTGVPVLLWGELHQTGVLGPFIKVGMGAIHCAIEEDYPDDRSMNLSNKFWSFAFGVGGGIRYCPINSVDILVVLESIVGTGSGVATDSFGRDIESESPFGSSLLGLTIRYWFNPVRSGR